jgi:hypothetical protein
MIIATKIEGFTNNSAYSVKIINYLFLSMLSVNLFE